MNEPMSRTNLVAFICALLLSAVAIGDAVAFGVTGVSLASDREGLGSILAGHGWLRVLNLIHATAYLGTVVVLLTVARPVFRGRPWRQVLRWLSLVPLALLGIGFLLGTVVPEAAVDLTIPFLLTLVVPGALGATLLGQGDRSPSAWLLTAAPLALIAAIVLGALGSPFAHPGYAEALAYCGYALLGWRVTRRDVDAGPVAAGKARVASPLVA